MDKDIRALNEKVKRESVFVEELRQEIGRVIVGQHALVKGLLIGLLADGHVLLEGVPGLAKTLTIKTLAEAIDAGFQRLQFTPDLLPADLIGTMIYNPRGEGFTVKKGPIFSNLILADEINRAPAKVQSALLEAMQERQVTIGEKTYALEQPFLVMATQNPIEQQGTYPLPEAQVDRFLLKLKIGYPTRDEEKEILRRMTGGDIPGVKNRISVKEILKARKMVEQIYVDDKMQNYIVDLVFATREPAQAGLKDMQDLIAYGASPRATISLTLAAKAYAFLSGRGFITPEDVKSVGPDVLRHRIIVTYEAEAEQITSEDIVKAVFDGVEVP
ncbi:MoxR family ATPase [candidate division FCPU426 bacterium]|nr:MoxR family ATPase [candidate division FCPU426 bacterium]